jgi:Mg2+ and Co2+ transporter CorA
MTTSHIVKHETEHKVNLSLFRHRGDVYAVAKETGYPIEYIQKIYKKLKKRRDRDTSYWIASGIMQTIALGYEQRVHSIMKYLDLLEGKEEIKVSECHHTFMKKKKENGQDVFVCEKCLKPCKVITLPRKETFELFSDLLDKLRKEDESLVTFADKMGFTGKEKVPNVNQQILVVDNKPIEIGNNIDKNTMEEIDKLTPLQREKTRKVLEQKLLESGREKSEK